MKKVAFLLLVLMLGLVLAACRNDEPTATPETFDPTGGDPQVEEPTIIPEPTSEPQPTNTPSTEVEEEEESEITDSAEPEVSSDQPSVSIINDEGGPVSISGVVTYTNPLFTMGTAEPVVILEDQAGFVERDEGFLIPLESQTLGQITSDYFTSPFSYTIALPIEPGGTLKDVDNDADEETGVQVFAVAYWTNIFGDPFLEERDLFGAAWSTAYVSTLVSDDANTEREIIGGKYLIYAPDDQQGFPTGFGEDSLLFTEDDPIGRVPQGYSIVNLDDEPFTFDRSRQAVVNLIEPESSALDDYSELTYSEAFDALVDQLTKEYAFTEYKNIDWEELRAEFQPRFVSAESAGNLQAYRRALRDFSWAIPDGHVNGPFISEDFQEAIGGGLGIAIRKVEDGRTIVNFLAENSQAMEAGIELGAEILSIDGEDIDEVVSQTIAFSAPFSTHHSRQLHQLRYSTRFPIDTEVDITWKNPGSDAVESATLTAMPEPDSFNFSFIGTSLDGLEQPVEYEILEDSGLGYVQIYSFSDNELLTIQLWERLMQDLNSASVPGLIVDMRQNGGGSGFLADQMAAYFFNEPHVLGNSGRYDDDLDDFHFDPGTEQRFYLPAEALRYDGQLAVIVGPNCASACEFFSYDMTVDDRAAIVGHYPTAGLGGGIKQVAMPEGEFFTFTQGRGVDADGNIHIEGKGVPPTIRVPVTEETLFSSGDPLLNAGVGHVLEAIRAEVVDAGQINIGDELSGTLEPGTRLQYALTLVGGDLFGLILESEDFDPVLTLYDESGNSLGSTAGGEAVLEELESPADLVLILEVSAIDDSGGKFTLSVTEG